MPKIKNVSGEDRIVALRGGSRLALVDEVFEVEPDEVYGLTCQEDNWRPVDAAAKRAHKDASAPDESPEPQEGDL